MVLLAGGAVLAGAAAVTAYGVAGRTAKIFGPSVYRGPGQRRSIALTFDDGPSEGTLSLLAYLDQENIKATFFQCGKNVQRLPHIARDVVSAGHELGNHTYSHPKLYLRTPWFVSRQFSTAQKIIEQATGVSPRFLRAPYGFKWFGLRGVQKRLHLLGVMWTVIGHDWEWPASRIAEHVLRHASPGGIVCLHDGRDIQINPDVSEMLTAVRTIVPALKSQGYRFETVSEILRTDQEAIPKHLPFAG